MTEVTNNVQENQVKKDNEGDKDKEGEKENKNNQVDNANANDDDEKFAKKVGSSGAILAIYVVLVLSLLF